MSETAVTEKNIARIADALEIIAIEKTLRLSLEGDVRPLMDRIRGFHRAIIK